MLRFSCILVFCAVYVGSLSAQLRVMSYNLLNFPTGNIQGRVDTLEKIVNYARPHLLMIQELKTAEGLADVTDMMNDLGYGDFAHSTFVEQQSPGSPGNLLQQAIVFDTEFLRMKSEGVVLTDYRDINEFVLYLNDPTLSIGSDTTFIYVYVTHLKSSTGVDNEQARLSMVNHLITHFEQIPSDSFVMFAGDFNLYTNTEPAYLAATNQNNPILLKDVFASFGDWPGSGFAHKEILTQATRSTQIYNDGAGGGVDDRFDFILFSENMMSESGPIHYKTNSFKSLGNTGLCYNQSITDCDMANEVPFEVLQAMYFMSDHIPQYCELESDVIDAIAVKDISTWSVELPQGNVVSDFLTIRLNGPRLDYQLIVLDMSGKLLVSEKSNQSQQQMNLTSLAAGLYVLKVVCEDGSFKTEKIIIRR